jgi:hypothetical protein
MKKNVIWEIMGYIALGLLIVGQVTIGFSFWIGQIAYLVADIIVTIRCFAVKQETSDKVKNIALTAICIGVMIVKFISG